MLPLAPLACAFLLLGARPPTTQRAPHIRCEAPEDDATYDACMKMRVSELKAELELRKIDTTNFFEKEELARALADARAEGRADPSLVDDFNRQSAESAFNADADSSGPDMEAAAEAAAGDGGLPGGMSPDMLQSLIEDPEMMALLRNPKMQEIMKAVMTGGPDAAKQYMDDPETRDMLAKVSKITGGGA